MSKKIKYYKVKPKFLRFASLHTTDVLLNTVNDHLAGNLYYTSGINPEYNKSIDKAMKHLANAYQQCNSNNEVKTHIKMEKY